MRIPFGSLPSMSALFLDYVTDWSRVREFLSAAIFARIHRCFCAQRPPLDAGHRERLCCAAARLGDAGFHQETGCQARLSSSRVSSRDYSRARTTPF